MHRLSGTGDSALIRRINTAIVLECIRNESPLSRARISERTGLNKATVSSLVSNLIAGGLVSEIGTGESSGGRKPVMLLFNAGAGHAVGIDVGVNYIRGLLTDLAGTPVARRETKIARRSPEDVLPLLHDVIRGLIGDAPASRYGVVGIGIGVSGIVDDGGTILFAPNLNWRNVPLRRLVEERFNLPCVIDNEANAGAAGELRYGAGRGFADQIYVSVGIGIGTGIIINRELYRGKSGFSGELGHMSIAMDGRQCSCGNLGCWELYASEKALIEHGEPYASFEAACAAAESGDGQAVRLLETIGAYLGTGIANIVNVFNPEAVILGNRICIAERFVRGAVEREIERRTQTYNREGMRLLFAELGEHSAVRGAAGYAISRFFDSLNGQGAG
ncbi:MAG: ROK family protein [Thermobacillus sp.]|uniref:ROK family transcriptional regulator n=1 Tax=Thermobacillus sp. TaxID=2108467 RepID=UPI000E36A6AF|nr:ROK family transcriptional regulator [Thermobacillus sp.]REK52182.1 MAG: ROK family protein [Thermobacillus sp.]